MNRLRYWLSSFFGIPKNQANGLMVLLPLCFLILFVPYIYDHYNFKPQEVASDSRILDSLLTVLESNVEYQKDTLGFIANSPSQTYSKPNTKKRTDRFDNVPKSAYKKYPKRKIITSFDVNSSDTIQLKQIRGIGSVLSKRIIKYRDLLGGFVSKDQYHEVYGLKDSVILALDTLAKITPQYIPKTININTANEWTLMKHPYINKKQAKAIVVYRKQHGSFNSKADLFAIHLLDSATILKVAPYLGY